MVADTDTASISAWFAGPKAENGEWLAECIRRIVQDYCSWRRNYFPEDGAVVNSALRRQNEQFLDAFDDRLFELLARLKADFPFQSPRYAAHMVAEQTLPSIAGYFAAMLYNPNNVSGDAAPVTVRLELEAAQMIARMLGYGPACWAHLTGGGTIANLEAMWIARTVAYLPPVVGEMRRALGLAPEPWSDEPRRLLRMSPEHALGAFGRCFDDAARAWGPGAETTRRVIGAYLDSRFNVAVGGLSRVASALNSEPVILAPETHHYGIAKAMDVLGLGRSALVRVRVDPDFRMIVDDLASKMDDAQASGRHVLAVVAVVGSTEEGAVDPINQIVKLRSEREAEGKGSFWLHADAAYGGYLRTVTVPRRLGLGEARTTSSVGGENVELPLELPEHSACEALEQLGECDSISVDPHKLGYVPYPAGAVCFRTNLVKPLARQEAPYLADPAGDLRTERGTEAIGPYILEGSKPGAAAAAVWLSHKLIPLDTTGHGLLIRETIRNACELHALLQRYPMLVPGQRVQAVPLCPPGSNIVCYAFRPAGKCGLGMLNAANRRIYERFTMQPGQRVYDRAFFVSRTTLGPAQYSETTVGRFLANLGVDPGEYRREGVFLLRSVLMNPWYGPAKSQGRGVLAELVAELYRAAHEELAGLMESEGRSNGR
jgi:glutamate/tyrosine decarboxylase-like PLP-dependent enzyme